MICADSLIPELWFKTLPPALPPPSPPGSDTLEPNTTSGKGSEFLVTGFATAEYAVQLRKLGKDAAITATINQLDQMFGGVASHGDTFIDGIMHDWSQEPFIRCGYSYPKLGGEDAFSELARPLPNGRVMFAGEAYTTGPNMTVHSALDSGARAAREAAQYLQSRRADRDRQSSSRNIPSRL